MSKQHTPEAEANAQLIISAPKLLAAVHEAAELLRLIDGATNDRDTVDLCGNAAGVLCHLEAAMDAAEGEAQ